MCIIRQHTISIQSKRWTLHTPDSEHHTYAPPFDYFIEHHASSRVYWRRKVGYSNGVKKIIIIKQRPPPCGQMCVNTCMLRCVTVCVCMFMCRLYKRSDPKRNKHRQVLLCRPRTDFVDSVLRSETFAFIVYDEGRMNFLFIGFL